MTLNSPFISETFTCVQCGETKPVQRNGGTGYGIYERNNPDAKVCYQCCGEIDRKHMIETGRQTLYLTTGQNGDCKVTNWPGTLSFRARYRVGSHNIAGRRYDVWFVGPDKAMWHGVQYGDNTQLCHCRRTKG